MHAVQAVVSAALPVFGLILVGYFCTRRQWLGPAAMDSLNRFVVYLALPAVLFQSMAQTTWSQLVNPGFLGAFGGGMAATFLLSFVLDRAVRGRLTDASIEGMGAAYPNAGFMGLPLCLVAFGPDSVPAVVVAMLLTATVLFAISIAIIETDQQTSPNVKQTVGKVTRALVRNPLVVSPFAGMALAAAHVSLPQPVLHFTQLLGGAASPCALIAIGMFLAQSAGAAKAPRIAKSVGRLVGLKLIFQPAITAWLAFRVFDLPALWSHSALLLAALPIGTGPFMLAQLYEREAAVASRAILLSTIGSVVTVSLLIAWFSTH
ncbi:malonate transporter [Pandoraea terrae]|uniref:Malonate transporter n=1 Tax=Pandoraea terrae TaxID=1537710 RepID=A0A5E4YL91_9BURK|nr:AEC family transporter [Pandoraea terrae]VVE49499.1 malonate transporter [Pandoraea terrae]